MNRDAPPKAHLDDTRTASPAARLLGVLAYRLRFDSKLYVIALAIAVVAGIAASRFRGTPLAFYITGAQIIALVICFTGSIGVLLCGPYGPKISRLIDSPAAQVVRLLLLLSTLSVAAFCIGFAVFRMASHES